MRPKTIADFHGEVRPSGEHLNYQVCPKCGHDGWKVYVNPLTGGWFCFAGRHNGGGMVEVGLPTDQITFALLELLYSQPTVPEWDEIDLPPWEPLSKSALRYLRNRNVSPESARTYGLVEWTDKFRIVIPYFYQGNLIYWNSRRYSTVGSGPSYLSAPGFKPLYFRHVSGSDQIALVEGVFDAWAVERAGISAVALGGKSLPSYLVRFLLTNTEKYGIIDVLLDADALNKALAIRNQLLSKRDVNLCTYPPGVDPADMTPDYIQELLK